MKKNITTNKGGFIKSTFKKKFTLDDFDSLRLIKDISEQLIQRHGNEETASILINLAYEIGKDINKGVTKDTLEFFRGSREVAVNSLK